MDNIEQKLKKRIDTLEERVRQLEEVLAPSLVQIPVEWGLSPSESRVFSHMTTRDIVTKESVMAALYSDKANDEIEIKIVDVFVCKIRKKLRRFDVVIRTIWGQGYALHNRQCYAVKPGRPYQLVDGAALSLHAGRSHGV